MLCHRLCRSEEEALRQPRGRIELVLCQSCGMVYNRAFDSGLIRYDGEYENALHFSDVFRKYMERLAKDLVARHGVRAKTVVEIGCGDGQFLKALCQAGDNDGIGFDPAFDVERHEAPANERIRILPKLFDASAVRGADVGLVCCRQVLEHIEQPEAFLARLRASLGKRLVPVFFEVPSAMHTLLRRGFWDVIYEHVTYFSPPAIRVLFERNGFDVSKVEDVYSGQFLTLAGCSGAGDSKASPSHAEVEELDKLTKGFGRRFEKLRAEWRGRLDSFRQKGYRVVLWGAGSKTVMFLNDLSAGPMEVAYVVDRNPRKQGCFIVGTGQQIISPADVGKFDPDVVILLNSAYCEEVRRDLSAIGSGATLEAFS